MENKTDFFGKILRYMREQVPYKSKKGMSVRTLAKNSKVSHPYISQIENGRRNIPLPSYLEALAKGLTIENKKMTNEMFTYLTSMAGYIKPEAHNIYAISRFLDLDFIDFLRISGYFGMMNEDEKNIEIIIEWVNRTWNEDDHINQETLEYQYDLEKNKVYLDNVYDNNYKIMLDSTELNEKEKLILKNTLDTIKDLRK